MTQTRDRGAGTLLMLVVWLWLLGCAGEAGPGTPDCAVGQLACGSACVDPMLDGAHCGGCGLTCPVGSTCSVGSCRASDGSIVAAISTIPPETCPVGQVVCGGACVDPTSNDAHCGVCNNACVAGNVCDQSACRPIGAACPPGRTLCGDVCADLTTSSTHCGQCDNGCGAGTCTLGTCSCAAGESLCGSACVNVSIDPENCGSCGVPCATGQACTLGSCACPAAQVLCDGACADLQSDAEHCGTCTTACAPGQSCTLGMCQCPAGLDLCAEGCVDLQTSVSDCGSCGMACSGGMECVGGGCQCPAGETDCAGTCVDLATDAAHCGACDSACTGGQVCGASTCACPESETLCDELCTDTTSSTEHCGACGQACVGGQVCNASTCECPEGQTLCDETCIDTETDDLNCGGCGNECGGGQTCQAGSCECPEGQSFCDGECRDTQTDDLNCGGCGVACGLGELCNAGGCQGGGLGEDGCQGVAENVSLERLSFYQTVEIALVAGGEEVSERNVDVVTGRDTLVRVFVEVGSGWSSRQLSARLFLDDGTERVTVYPEAPRTISGSSEADDRDSTIELWVSGDLLRESTRYAVELVECDEPPGDAVQSPRFPAQDGADLDAVAAGGLRIHLVPLEANGRLPDTSEEQLEALRQGFLATYPIDSLEFTVSESYEVPDAQDWVGNLEALRGLRSSESPDPGVYYYGLIRPTESIRDFCGGGCTAGIGYVPNGNGGIAQSGRVSLGLAYGDEESLRTMLHEIGHNHGRNHAPCVPPGSSIAGVDQNYPYDNAAIGVYGYDARRDTLIPPDAPDVMAYCNDPWFSDYTYRGLLDTILSVNQTQQSIIVDPTRVGEFWVLAVEPNRTRWLNPRPGVVTADGIAMAARVLDRFGGHLADIEVYKNPMADTSAFSVDVPAPEPDWHVLELPGVGRVQF